jgi:uroporphyrinogen-III synthase
MTDAVTGGKLVGRTILLSSRLRKMETVLRQHGCTVMTWPELAIQRPQSFTGLDEAIENLFGYDWLIFVNADAARFFLERFIKQRDDLSDLDSLRVCAIDEVTAAALEQSHVHVDVIVTDITTPGIIETVANYVGGSSSLQRLNVLIPQASIGRDYLKPELEAADARADVVAAYQTVEINEVTRLSVLQSLLLTGSADAVVFANESDVSDFARIFDMNDLRRLLRNVAVFVADQQAAAKAMKMGIPAPLISEFLSREKLAEALMGRFSA